MVTLGDTDSVLLPLIDAVTETVAVLVTETVAVKDGVPDVLGV